VVIDGVLIEVGLIHFDLGIVCYLGDNHAQVAAVYLIIFSHPFD
jgi:hypothetical protein